MSKFCSNCGTEMPDYAVICGECGTPFEKQEPPKDFKGKLQALVEDKKKLLITAGGAALALIILIVLISSVVKSNSPEGIAKKVAKATMNGHITDTYDYYIVSPEDDLELNFGEYYEDIEEYLEEIYDVSSIKEYMKQLDEEYAEDLEDEYGDFKYKITKIKIDEYSKKELRELKEDDLEDRFERYEDICDLDVDDVKTACDFTVKIKITDEDDDTDKITMEGTMIKIKGKWKILDIDMD